jgi:transcriptional regulator with XRE-family HTH domain
MQIASEGVYTLDVGVRLQSIRKLKGLSQRELAKRAGVTNSTISMIEKNSVSPSISSLKKVLAGIPMSLVEFFSVDFEENGAAQIVYKADELTDLSPCAWWARGIRCAPWRFLTRPIRRVPTPARKCSTMKAKRLVWWSPDDWS